MGKVDVKNEISITIVRCMGEGVDMVMKSSGSRGDMVNQFKTTGVHLIKLCVTLPEKVATSVFVVPCSLIYYFIFLT